MKNRCLHASGFTLVELLVALGLIALVLTVTIAVWSRSRQTQNQVHCTNNLRQIGQALLLYSNAEKGPYPRTRYAPAATVTPTWGTGAAAQDPFGEDGPAPNDVSAAMFLLLRTQDISPIVFVCPSSDQTAWDFGGPGRTAKNWSNWNGAGGIAKHLSYSYANPYPDEAPPRSYKHISGFGGNFAVAADKNPGGPGVLAVTSTSASRAMRAANSRNHSRRGQNVLYDDGHIEFQPTPFVGVKGDNIFARRSSAANASSSIVASPYDTDDSVLLPSDE